jgi:4-amino-4-deoxy-L-arabinose transferase-like glycosyltransferase
MPEARLSRRTIVYLLILAALTLLPGLGSARRLTYHEALVAQGAREILASDNWSYPTIGGLPWLEKPPLPWWLVAGLGCCMGGVTESVARLPSAMAATGLVLGVALLATRHYGPRVGLLAGAVQVTTTWTVLRGRLAEADILLACLVTWALVAFDHIITDRIAEPGAKSCILGGRQRLWCWAFFVLLGFTALVKGIGFGAVLILVVVAGILFWQRDLVSLRWLNIPAGWALAVVIALSWPFLMVMRHGYGALSLWAVHVSDRLIPQQGPGLFASELWWEYILGLMGQALPWTPLALVGAWHSLNRAFQGAKSAQQGVSAQIPEVVIAGDRLLWVWGMIPVSLLALAPIRNAHYAISAQVPWSIWAALALVGLGEQLWLRGYSRATLIWARQALFGVLALSYGLGLWLLGPWFDQRGIEWAFYEAAGRQIPADMPVSLLYDDWDRNPYESPFGLIPHDLAVRLFYLARSTCWHIGPSSLLAHDHVASGSTPITSCLAGHGSPMGLERLPLAVIGRDRDLPVLEQLGHVEVVMRGPGIRHDRTYSLFLITSRPTDVRSAERVPARSVY